MRKWDHKDPESSRIMNVEPISDAVLQGIYSQQDELDHVAAKRLREAQSQQEGT